MIIEDYMHVVENYGILINSTIKYNFIHNNNKEGNLINEHCYNQSRKCGADTF